MSRLASVAYFGLGVAIAVVAGLFLPTLWVLGVFVASLIVVGIAYFSNKRGVKRDGPIIVCVDKSGSMHGTPEKWAHHVVSWIQVEAVRRKRDMHVLYFDHDEKVPLRAPLHQCLPRGLGKLVDPPYANGGTRYDAVLSTALTLCDQRSNIVFITDGMAMAGTDKMPRHDGIKDLWVTGLEITHNGYEWPLPFADEVLHVDGYRLLDKDGTVGLRFEEVGRQIARRF